MVNSGPGGQDSGGVSELAGRWTLDDSMTRNGGACHLGAGLPVHMPRARTLRARVRAAATGTKAETQFRAQALPVCQVASPERRFVSSLFHAQIGTVSPSCPGSGLRVLERAWGCHSPADSSPGPVAGLRAGPVWPPYLGWTLLVDSAPSVSFYAQPWGVLWHVSLSQVGLGCQGNASMAAARGGVRLWRPWEASASSSLVICLENGF